MGEYCGPAHAAGTVVVNVPVPETTIGGGVIVKAYVEVISCCFVVVDVIVVVHLTVVFSVTVLVAVVRGTRLSHAWETTPGLHVESAVGVGLEGLFSIEARLLTERVGPLYMSKAFG